MINAYVRMILSQKQLFNLAHDIRADNETKIMTARKFENTKEVNLFLGNENLEKLSLNRILFISKSSGLFESIHAPLIYRMIHLIFSICESS